MRHCLTETLLLKWILGECILNKLPIHKLGFLLKIKFLEIIFFENFRAIQISHISEYSHIVSYNIFKEVSMASYEHITNSNLMIFFFLKVPRTVSRRQIFDAERIHRSLVLCECYYCICKN